MTRVRRRTASLLGIILALLAAAPAAAQTLPPVGTRLDTFTPSGTRTGVVEGPDRTGRLDFFAPSGRRTGYGEINRYGDGKLDLYDTRGRRLGTGVLSPSGGRRR